MPIKKNLKKMLFYNTPRHPMSVHKKISLFGSAVRPAIGNIYMNKLIIPFSRRISPIIPKPGAKRNLSSFEVQQQDKGPKPSNTYSRPCLIIG